MPNTLRLLVADDNATMRSLLTRILESHAGWSVIAQVADGSEAIERTKELQPDVVVLDLNMPQVDGVKAAREISATFPAIKIVGLSVDDSPSIRQLAIEAGAQICLSKSKAGAELIPALESLFTEPLPPKPA